jgi:hypothetical protein
MVEWEYGVNCTKAEPIVPVPSDRSRRSSKNGDGRAKPEAVPVIENQSVAFTSALQKPEGFSVKASEGEDVVVYCHSKLIYKIRDKH